MKQMNLSYESQNECIIYTEICKIEWNNIRNVLLNWFNEHFNNAYENENMNEIKLGLYDTNMCSVKRFRIKLFETIF